MRTALLAGVGLALALAFVAGAWADEKKAEETTLKGKITCAKCELKKEKECATVIIVKEKDEEVVYYFDKDAHKKHHKPVCMKGKEGSVTGMVAEKDGKKWITVSKLEWAEKKEEKKKEEKKEKE